MKRAAKIGLYGPEFYLETAEVLLQDCRIPAENVLGGLEKLEGKLEKPLAERRSSAALKTFEMTRPSVAARRSGFARAAFEFARDYAKERRTFGRPIIETRGSRSSSPTWRWRSTPPAC